MAKAPWMPIAQSFVGTTEWSGLKKNNPVIMKFFEDVGSGWVKNDETPWCAAFVGAMLEEVNVKSTGALNAKSYLDWGKRVKKPRWGDVVVFHRGNPKSWQGHVAFFIRETARYVYVLGGNQRNGVNVQRYSKKKIAGIRRPSTMATSRTVFGAGAVMAGSGGIQAAEPLSSAAESLLPLSGSSAWIAGICTVLTLAGVALVIYARWDDLKNKGR